MSTETNPFCLSQDALQEACEKFCETIEATGGLADLGPGTGGLVPAADDEWGDLADAYLCACKALGREPKIAPLDQPADPLVERDRPERIDPA